MARSYSLPFKTVVGGEIVPGAWHVRSDGGDLLRLGRFIAGWDYLTAVELHREVSLDPAAVRAACGLPADADLALVVTASAPAARFRRVVAQEPILASVSALALSFRLPSAELAGRLHLDTEVVLRAPAAPRDRFAARLPGSRLFSETVWVDLEGSGSRLPMEVASFSRHLTRLNAPHAPWHVECGLGDLHLPVMQELRVYLNTDAAAILDAIMKGDSNLQRLLKAEVARRLIETAFQDDEFRSGTMDFAEGTMGEAAARLVGLCFPDMNRKDVSVLAAREPARFEAAVRSHFMAPV